MNFHYRADQTADGTPLLTLTGSFDLGSVTRLREEFKRLLQPSPKRIIVDLNGVSYIDSSGLGVLVGALSRLRENGGDLCIIVSNPKIRRIFEITKLSYVFPLFDSLSAIP